MASENVAAMREALKLASYFLHQHHMGAVYAPDGETTISCWDVAKVVDSALSEPPEQPTNASAMHGALEKLLAWLDKHGNSYTYIDGTPADEAKAIWQERQEIVAQCRAALAEPARNCDVGTPDEQQEWFREFCRRHNDAGECGIGRTHAKCPCWSGPKNPDCALWWAQMPYEKKEESDG